MIDVPTVCGWNLLVARTFGAGVIDWVGAVGLYLLVQAVVIPVYAQREGQQAATVKVKR